VAAIAGKYQKISSLAVSEVDLRLDLDHGGRLIGIGSRADLGPVASIGQGRPKRLCFAGGVGRNCLVQVIGHGGFLRLAPVENRSTAGRL